jgi:hypothetical protein
VGGSTTIIGVLGAFAVAVADAACPSVSWVLLQLCPSQQQEVSVSQLN